MTQVLSKLTSKAGEARFSRLAMASSTAALLYWSYLLLKGQGTSKSSKQKVLFLDRKAIEKKKKSQKRVDFNVTLRQLTIILKSIMSYKDIALTCGVTLGLILRTLLDLWNIQISTKVESAIITANPDQLKYTLLSFALTMPTLAFVNNIIKFFTDKLSLNLRYNLSKSLYKKYMNELTFYHLNQNSDFQNVDQLLTADVDKFASSIVDVYNNLSKPVLDIVLLVHRMTTGYTGSSTPVIMISWLAFVGSVLTQARKPLSGYIIRETQAEGQLRFVHSRLIQNSEEVAFYNGNQKEKQTLMGALDELKQSLDDSILFKFKIGLLDNIVGRYMSTIVGYLALARPFFSERYTEQNGEDRLTQYYVSGRMMMKLAESITRVILAGQDLSKLAAYTQRVQSLTTSMEQLYIDSSSVDESSSSRTNGSHNTQKINATTQITDNHHEDYEGEKEKERAKTGNRLVEVAAGEGGAIVEICDKDNLMIDFNNVTLTTPNGDILVKDLTFTIKPHQSVIIAGPNGSGKSSLFRVLGGLWRVESGKLIRPPRDELFYICQKPYMTLGSLRNQLIFPDAQSKLSDEQLTEILKIVELKYLLDRGEHTLNSINDWQDVLSGGEKQRMALARLIYHKPKFAILDECTSAVAIDVEQRIYKYLSEEMKCTLISVSHRVKQLSKFHHLILEFDGEGGYEFKRLLAQI